MTDPYLVTTCPGNWSPESVAEELNRIAVQGYRLINVLMAGPYFMFWQKETK